MFGLLKNKLSNFISSLAGREEKKPAEAPPEKPQEQAVKEETRAAPPTPASVPEKKPQEISKSKPVPVAEKKTPEREQQPVPKKEEPLLQPKPERIPQVKAPPTPAPVPEKKKSFLDIVASPFSRKEEPRVPEQKKTEVKAPEQKKQETKPLEQKKPEPAKPAIQVPAPKPSVQAKPEFKPPEQKKPEARVPSPKQPAQAPIPPEHDLSGIGRRAGSDKHIIAPKIGIGTSIKSFFSNEITIGEAEVSDLLEELELSLLEADVAYDVSIEVISQLRSSLVGMKVPRGEVGSRTSSAIQGVLESVMDSDRKFNFMERVKSLDKPVKILFVGPNGAGKTTTMAKLAHMLIGSGFTVVFSASDTFRAAAIEQTEVHAGRLGVKVIKSKYGADPASVAFDAINYARANSIDVVLIDSAGRQDTNANLLSELVKINRIAKPDMKIYIGESIGGNSVIDQIRAFDTAIGMDGAILTKIDCDAKGGTAISIAKSTGIPVLFLGIGQGYSDLVPFDPHKIASEIMS